MKKMYYQLWKRRNIYRISWLTYFHQYLALSDYWLWEVLTLIIQDSLTSFLLNKLPGNSSHLKHWFQGQTVGFADWSALIFKGLILKEQKKKRFWISSLANSDIQASTFVTPQVCSQISFFLLVVWFQYNEVTSHSSCG